MRPLRVFGVAGILLASGCVTTNLDIADSCIDRWNREPPPLDDSWTPEYALVSVNRGELGYDSCGLVLVGIEGQVDCYSVRPDAYINPGNCNGEVPDSEGGVLTRYAVADGQLSR